MEKKVHYKLSIHKDLLAAYIKKTSLTHYSIKPNNKRFGFVIISFTDTCVYIPHSIKLFLDDEEFHPEPLSIIYHF